MTKIFTDKKTRRWLIVKLIELVIVGAVMIGTIYVCGAVAEGVAHLLGV